MVIADAPLRDRGTTYLLQQFWEIRIASPYRIEEQLGLKLKPQKDDVETIVIDRLEPPSENSA
jgi:hypothetical protein